MFSLVEGFGRKKKVENLNSFLRIFFFWALLFLDSEGSDSSRKWIKKIDFFSHLVTFFYQGDLDGVPPLSGQESQSTFTCALVLEWSKSSRKTIRKS